VACSDGSLVGFVNILWDGLVHARIQDLVVASSSRRQRIGVSLIEVAVGAGKAAGCEWLHVDFDDHLKPFYLDVTGFETTNASLINLTEED
jgi:ribosomal protein S18 acetylase RimI-like enzyme